MKRKTQNIRRAFLATLPAVLLTTGCAGLAPGNRANRAAAAAPGAQPRAEPVIQVDSGASLDVNLLATEQGLRVGIALPERGTDRGAHAVEIHAVPSQLRKTMEDSQHWAAVRLAPPQALGNFDLWINLELLQSNGMVFTVRARAEDALRSVWLNNVYTYRTTEADVDASNSGDVYAPLYARIANDLARIKDSRPAELTTRLKEVREMFYASSYSPKYRDSFTPQADGLLKVVHIPAEGDETWGLIREIQEAESAYLDQLTTVMEAHRLKISDAYRDYRRAGRSTVQRMLEVEEQQGKVAGEEAAIATQVRVLDAVEQAIMIAEALRQFGLLEKNREKRDRILGLLQGMRQKLSDSRATLAQLRNQAAYHQRQSKALEQEFNTLSATLGDSMRKVSVWLKGELVELTGTAQSQHGQLRKHFLEMLALENASPTRPISAKS